MTYLPRLGIPNGTDAVRVPHLFQKDSICHSIPPGVVYLEIRESGCTISEY
jgi:hypothetical protein